MDINSLAAVVNLARVSGQILEETASTVAEAASTVFSPVNYGDNNDVGMAEGYAPNSAMYKVIITQKTNSQQRYAVGASAPPSFNLSVHNNFIDFSTFMEGLFGGTIGGTAVRSGALVSAGAQTAGLFNQARFASFQIWGGTSPLSFPLQIEFRAFKDPQSEVIEPVKNLLWMASASSGGAFLNSPSPSLREAMAAIRQSATTETGFLVGLNKTISVKIGTRFFLAGLVIENLQLEISGAAERNSGLPMAIKANVEFKTIISYSREDIMTAFYGTNFGSNKQMPNVY